MFLFLVISFIGYLDTITNQGVLLEKEGRFYPFLIKNYTVFINFSTIDDLKFYEKLKVDFIEIEGVPVALKLEKLKGFQVNALFEVQESIIKGNIKKFNLLDIREKDEFLKFHLPLSSNKIFELKEPILIYGDDNQDERVVEEFLKLKLKGIEEVFVYSGGFKDWNEKGNPFFTEPEAIINYSENFILIDVRNKKEREKGVIPYAYFKEIEQMKWEDFSSKDGMPALVFYGEDEKDERPQLAAEKALKWRYEGAKNGPVSILRGGLKELQRKGFKLEKREIREFGKEILKKEGEVSLEILSEPKDFLFVDLTDEGESKAEFKFPLNKIDENIKKLQKDKKLVLFCYEGKRAKIAYFILKRLNFDVKYISEEINF